jgi:hypothetical protein
MASVVQAHTHNGNDSPKLSTADFIKIIRSAGPPTWAGREGEMVFENSGSDFNIWVWLDSAWRQFAYTP